MLISVIIPCYNVEAFISECVDSVLNQTYQEIEIICIDNNSSDNTWQTLIQLKNIFPHLIIDKEIKAGACAARNKGLNIANGYWVQFLDADDLLLPKKIEHQVELLKCNSNIAFVAGSFIISLLNLNIFSQVYLSLINENNRSP
jgi:glycosyltransferase involved in cell wall biosynthesis